MDGSCELNDSHAFCWLSFFFFIIWMVVVTDLQVKFSMNKCFALTVSLNGFISINEWNVNVNIHTHLQKMCPITNYMAFHMMSCVLFIAVGIFGFYFCTDDKQTNVEKKTNTSQHLKLLSKFIQWNAKKRMEFYLNECWMLSIMPEINR